MADKKNIMIPPQGGVVRDFILRVKLILRLVGDKRVNPCLKLIPVAGLIYLISPIDLIPDIAFPIIGELDDAAVLWITNYFFVELCPPEIVREHVNALSTSSGLKDDDVIVDADSVEIKDKKQ
jgi:uncharacterized membrane protein YkvA (DUF1232 family)